MTVAEQGGACAPATRPGWYIVQVAPVQDQGGARLLAELTQADGTRRDVPLGLLHQSRNRRVLLPIPRDVTAINVQAVEGSCRTAVPARVIRINRAGAAFLLLLGPEGPDGRRSGSGLWRNLGFGVRCLVTGRPRQLIRALASAYQAAMQPAADERPSAPCTIPRRAGSGWRPLHQLTCTGSADGCPEWTAEDDDPQLRLEHLDGAPVQLSAGWYRLEFLVDVRSGRIVSPAIYPDYGSGCQAYDMIPLPEPDARGRIRALVLLKAPVSSLRFDPSVRRVRFAVLASSLRRVGRFRAFSSMFDQFRAPDGRRDWAATTHALLSFVRDAAASGVSAATGRLHHGPASDELDYGRWVQLYDTLDAKDRQMMRERARLLEDGPLVSILVPVYETPERWLRRCLDSVLAQAYENWELCVVDDASPSPHVSRILEQYSRRDARIRFMRRQINGHISAASNDALAMATGELVALLDHDDELRPHALLEMVECFAKDPRIALAYSDEDKIDEVGRRFQPNFKPDWNPDLLLSQNYVCHLTVLRTALAREVGGFRTGYEGSQDHDLFLRCSERLSPEQVAHVPRVLYHWRAIQGSTALTRGAKDYASAAGVRAVADHLARVAPGATAEELAHGHYRVRWPLPSAPPRVSIIVPTRDRVDLLRDCVDSVLTKTTYPDFEIIIVDNQSEDPRTLAWLEQIQVDSRVRVVRYDAPFNYSAINNMAASLGTGEVLCLLNNDVEVRTPGWLEELVSHAIRPGVGAVGAMLLYPDSTIQHAGVVLGLGGVANHIYMGLPVGSPGFGARALVTQNLSAVTGACLVVSKQVYQQVGGLEEDLQVAFNDIDFCLRLREAGLNNVWTPFAQLIHHESASRGRDETEQQRARFSGEVAYMERRWGDWLDNDPAYNPNLSLADLSSGFAFPPRAPRAVPGH